MSKIIKLYEQNAYGAVIEEAESLNWEELTEEEKSCITWAYYWHADYEKVEEIGFANVDKSWAADILSWAIGGYIKKDRRFNSVRGNCSELGNACSLLIAARQDGTDVLIWEEDFNKWTTLAMATPSTMAANVLHDAARLLMASDDIVSNQRALALLFLAEDKHKEAHHRAAVAYWIAVLLKRMGALERAWIWAGRSSSLWSKAHLADPENKSFVEKAKGAAKLREDIESMMESP